MEETNNQILVKHKDPVCNMWVLESDAKVLINYNGVDYYFCSIECAKTFESEPLKYIQNENSSLKDQKLNTAHKSSSQDSVHFMNHQDTTNTNVNQKHKCC
ncbi:YHS domain-containing protein, partial [Desulfurella sp.]|uniref:YHS domain-containing protein n=1 Tax=Desulfurella sp. TaxID=1962857 RepID=UPI0025BE2E4D